MTAVTVYDEKLRNYVSQTFGEKIPVCSSIIPEMIRFQDFVAKKHTENCHMFICERFKEHDIPFPCCSDFYFRETVPVYTKILNINIHRTDHISVCTETAVSTAFSNGKNIYRFRFCITGTFSTEEKCCLFRCIIPFRKKHISDTQALSEYLVPYLKKENFDSEAERILQLYFPDALRSPVPVNAAVLAENMGYKVCKARLSEDNSKLGSIFFEEGNIICWSDGKKTVKNVPANTILIDTQAIRARRSDINSVIIHECIHAYEHRLFYHLQKLCFSQQTEDFPEFEDIAGCKHSDYTLQWLEHQAVHLSPRILMPASQTAVKAAELYERFRDLPAQNAYRMTVSELSEFYGVPEIVAENRLSELGYAQ